MDWDAATYDRDRGPDDPLGHRRARPAAAAGRRDGARRRLRLGPGHRAPGRPPAARPGRRARRLARDDRGGPRAARAVRRPGELRDRGPGRAPAAGRRERRRDPVHGDLPLGRGPRGAVPASRLGPAARRAAGRAVRRAGQHRRGPGGAGGGGRRLARAVDVRLAGGDDAAARGRRVHRVEAWLDRRADADRARRAAAGVPPDGRSSAPTWSGCRPPTEAAFVEAVADPPADVVDRLRPAQHPRDASRTPASRPPA